MFQAFFVGMIAALALISTEYAIAIENKNKHFVFKELNDHYTFPFYSSSDTVKKLDYSTKDRHSKRPSTLPATKRTDKSFSFHKVTSFFAKAIEKQPFALFVPAYLLWLAFLITVYRVKPLSILAIHNALTPYENILGSRIKLPLSVFLFVGVICYRPRVLDKWISRCVAFSAREHFEHKTNVLLREVHIDLPVTLNGKLIQQLSAHDLRPTFGGGPGRLLICGEGGAGKTSLACQLGKWSMSDKKKFWLSEHQMLPVLIDFELDFEVPDIKHPLTEAIRGQIQEVVSQHLPMPDGLFDQLLRHRRILVIVDSLSEMNDDTRKHIRPESPDFPPIALIVTSRRDEKLGGGRTELNPLRLERNRLAFFLAAYFDKCGKRDLFDDTEFAEVCSRLTTMVMESDRAITVLLARLYADQVITSKERMKALPLIRIPDLMIQYVNELNSNISEGRIDDRTVQRAAKTVAWECLKENYIASSAHYETVLRALGGKDSNTLITYLEKRLRLIEVVQPAQDKIRFLLDTLAEYLAAHHLIELYGNNSKKWRQLFNNKVIKDGSRDLIRSFFLAVRDCAIANADLKDSSSIELGAGSLAGVDQDALEREKLQRRIYRLMTELSFLGSNVESRCHASEQLGNMGIEAKIVVPSLIKLCNEESMEVRAATAAALMEIGGAFDRKMSNSIVSVLLQAVKLDDLHIRRRATQAFWSIGPNFSSAVPTLVNALSDGELLIRVAAAESLGKMGKDARRAIRRVSLQLHEENELVRGHCVNSLNLIERRTDAEMNDSQIKKRDQTRTRIQSCKLVRVIDTDTLIIELEKGVQEWVKLIYTNTEGSLFGGDKYLTKAGIMAANLAKEYFNADEYGIPRGDTYIDIEFDSADSATSCLMSQRDELGGLLCYVYRGEKNYNVHVVSEGWSPYFYKHGRSKTLDREFRDAEEDAEKRRLGIWNPNINRRGYAKDYKALRKWWRIRASIVDNYRINGLNASVLSVRENYMELVEAAVSGSKETRAQSHFLGTIT